MSGLAKILAGSDLSEWADLALQRAALLAGQHRSSLSLLHVEDRAEPPKVSQIDRFEETQQGFMDLLADEAKAALDARAEALAEQHSIEISVHVQHGKDFVEIIRRAREEGAELIVLGAHGQHYLRDWLLGTTLERVIRKGDRPVLVVKRKPKGVYHRVLVAVDFSIHGQRALECAMRLAPDAEFHVLHVCDLWYEGRLRAQGVSKQDIAALHREETREHLDELDRFLTSCKIDRTKVKPFVKPGYPGPTIATEAARLGADLVTIGTHGGSGLFYVLLGSVAVHVLRETECDVLAVRPVAAQFGVP